MSNLRKKYLILIVIIFILIAGGGIFLYQLNGWNGWNHKFRTVSVDLEMKEQRK